MHSKDESGDESSWQAIFQQLKVVKCWSAMDGKKSFIQFDDLES